MKKIFILGGSSDIGIEIIKIYLKNNYKVLAHYNKLNNKLSNLKNYQNNNLDLIKFNFVNSEKNICTFLKQKKIIECDVVINALGYIKQKSYKNIKLKDIIDTIKVNFFLTFI